MQFCSYARIRSGLKQREDKVSFEFRLYCTASAPGVREAFPNISIALRIYLSLLVTICSGERSIPIRARVHNNLRTTMTDQRLSHLSLTWSEILTSTKSLTYSQNPKHVSKMLNNFLLHYFLKIKCNIFSQTMYNTFKNWGGGEGATDKSASGPP